MARFKLLILPVIVAVLITGTASAQVHITPGGRAAKPITSAARIAKVLKQCRTHQPRVSFVIVSRC